MSLYDDLGVAKDASKEVIKKAFRKKAQTAHPDKGGDADKFYQIVKAGKVLTDDEKRKRYDETGADDEAADPNAEALTNLAGFFLKVVEENEGEYVDLFDLVRKEVVKGIEAWSGIIRGHEGKLAKLEKVVKRTKKKGAGDNFFKSLIDQQILKQKGAIESAKKNVETGHRMKKLLDEYEYEVSKRPNSATMSYQCYTGLGGL